VAVLVGLVVVASLIAAMLRVSLSHRRLVRDQERRLQAEWLAESGVRRALARLAANPDYPGETWSIASDALPSPGPDIASRIATRNESNTETNTNSETESKARANAEAETRDRDRSQPQGPSAVVSIAVERRPDEPGKSRSLVRVRVQADYPADPLRRARHVRQFDVAIKPSSRSSSPNGDAR
jgi:Tfp pilus assembly protein PilX